MKIFFDTEFTGLHQHTSLISIGCVSEDGREFYGELDDFDWDQVDPWVKSNVIDHLWIQNPEKIVPPDVAYSVGFLSDITGDLSKWLEQFNDIEMWGDCLAYDWVLFCELFGGAMKLPHRIYYIPFDLGTLLKVRGVDPDVDRCVYSGLEGLTQHNALDDAWAIRACHNKIA